MLLARSRRAALLAPPLIVAGGIILRFVLALQHPGDGAVSFQGFQLWIYYPTWTRLDPLLFGVVLAAIEKFRPRWWNRLLAQSRWLALMASALIAFGLWLGEGDVLTVAAVVWQFPLIAAGMALLVIYVVRPGSLLQRREIPGAAFLASIAYSVYLSHKLVIHFAQQLCGRWQLARTDWRTILLVEVLIYFCGALLFFAVERPFLQLRRRLTADR